ncbi:MAG: glycosyltransferase [Rhizobium sp.]|nr:glycosyltransferase [Rhizobium sp.]
MARNMRLSICVPSRNRQYYFQKTIEGLLRSKRDDLEFVLVDNSDDPSVMNDYMRAHAGDPRIVYLPSADRTLPMIENWERTLAAATGDWVTVIGDDDFIDPDVMTVLKKVVAVNPETEAFAWGVVAYSWPSPGQKSTSIHVPFNSFVVKVPREQLLKRMFGWYEATTVPTSGYSIYHSAVSRDLLDRIRRKYGGRFFEHPVIDYDMAMKVMVEGKHFAFCQRTFSVMGSCPESNSFSIGKLADIKKKVDIFMAELGRNFDDDPLLKDFPFQSILGVTASIGICQQWFRAKYKLTYDGWEKNFAKSCAFNTEMFRDEESFNIVRDGYTTAFKNWRRGRFLEHFQPVFKDARYSLQLSGSNVTGTFIRSDIAGVTTPVELLDIINGMIRPADQVEVRPDGLRFPWEEEMLTPVGEKRPIQTMQKRVA